jgi:hypothetical protein
MRRLRNAAPRVTRSRASAVWQVAPGAQRPECSPGMPRRRNAAAMRGTFANALKDPFRTFNVSKGSFRAWAAQRGASGPGYAAGFRQLFRPPTSEHTAGGLTGT